MGHPFKYQQKDVAGVPRTQQLSSELTLRLPGSLIPPPQGTADPSFSTHAVGFLAATDQF